MNHHPHLQKLVLKARQEAPGRIDVHHVHVQVALERLEHPLGLLAAQQPVVDEDTGELVADRAMDQRGGHCRVMFAPTPMAAGQCRPPAARQLRPVQP